MQLNRYLYERILTIKIFSILIKLYNKNIKNDVKLFLDSFFFCLLIHLNVEKPQLVSSRTLKHENNVMERSICV